MTTNYLSAEQVDQLLRPINGKRVNLRDGLSHLEAYEVRAHLNRIFGFARWSGDVLDMTLLYEQPTETRQGKPAFKVAYRCVYRLSISAPDGTSLATYTESAVGESVMPDFKRGDCHDMAAKTAESQAFKRCCINLGDQFGLSLYNKADQKSPLVMATLVQPEGTDTTGPVPDVDAHVETVAPEDPPTYTDDEPDHSLIPSGPSPSSLAGEGPEGPGPNLDQVRAAILADPPTATRERNAHYAKLMAAAVKSRILGEQIADENGEPTTVKDLIERRMLGAAA